MMLLPPEWLGLQTRTTMPSPCTFDEPYFTFCPRHDHILFMKGEAGAVEVQLRGEPLWRTG
jgi:hypothetical protein